MATVEIKTTYNYSYSTRDTVFEWFTCICIVRELTIRNA